MDTSLVPFGQVLRTLCLFKHWSHYHATVVLGRCPGTTPHSNCHISQLTHPIEVFLIILELACHKLCIPYGILITHSSRGWEAFATPGAIIHTSLGCHSRVPFVPIVFQAFSMEWCAAQLPLTGVLHVSLVMLHLYVRHIYNGWVRWR
jgi:hypothetical protein